MSLLTIAMPFTILGFIGLSELFKKSTGKKTKAKAALAVFLIIEAFFAYFMFVAPKIKESAVLSSGLSYPAQVVSVKQTGNYRNHNPEVEMVLAITPDKKASYTTSLEVYVQQIDLFRFVEGASLTVLVDKDDPHNILIKGFNTP
ncbi:MAG: hypothetical protein JXR91_02315 [Deltaproteobacteria bacterium]|nr:hypothetical protein [Deltaproteobacteria bacterium]